MPFNEEQRWLKQPNKFYFEYFEAVVSGVVDPLFSQIDTRDRLRQNKLHENLWLDLVPKPSLRCNRMTEFSVLCFLFCCVAHKQLTKESMVTQLTSVVFQTAHKCLASLVFLEPKVPCSSSVNRKNIVVWNHYQFWQ